MTFEKLLSSSAVAIPLLHIFVCFIYLCGYSTGFGGGVGAIFGAADLFGIAVQGVAEVYFLGLLLPCMLILYMNHTMKIPFIGTVDVVGNPDGFSITEARMNKYVIPSAQGVFFAILTVQIVSVIYAIYADERFPYSIVHMILVVTYIYFFYEMIEKLPIRKSLKGGSWLLISLPVTAVVAGLSAGQIDRREGFAMLSKTSIRCGNYAVRKKAGDYFIAVDRLEHRHLIDKDCAAKMSFPPKPRFLTADEEAAKLRELWVSFKSLVGLTSSK